MICINDKIGIESNIYKIPPSTDAVFTVNLNSVFIPLLRVFIGEG
jgi:hypothetical protein